MTEATTIIDLHAVLRIAEGHAKNAAEAEAAEFHDQAHDANEEAASSFGEAATICAAMARDAEKQSLDDARLWRDLGRFYEIKAREHAELAGAA